MQAATIASTSAAFETSAVCAIALPPSPVMIFDGLLGRGGIAVDAEHLRALAREGDRGRLAVAPAGADRAGADHHRNLALEPIHRGLPFLFCYSNCRNASPRAIRRLALE